MIGQGVHVSIAAHFNKLWSLNVIASDDQMGADGASVIKSMAAKSASCHLDSVLAAGVKSVHFEFALNHFYKFLVNFKVA